MNIWVNGCFDILHTGHIDLLWYAKLYNTKNMCYDEAIKTNKLIVGLDSDDRVKQMKGDDRPINDLHTRVILMSNLKMVDEVVVFHDDEEMKFFISAYDIDYIVIGNQYQNKNVIGSENSKCGVVYYPVDNNSSTNIIEKIRS